MTRKFLFSICFLLASFSIAAAPLDGIRIESEGQPIIVLIDGQQVCTPTLSCFIANLRRGSYRVEVVWPRGMRIICPKKTCCMTNVYFVPVWK